jgi:two-component sensor histidine kinase
VPVDARAPYAVRRHIDALDLRLPEEQLDDIMLLTNELVTNSVMHAASDSIEIRIHVEDALIRVEVADADTKALPAPQDAGYEDVSGRGLLMLDLIADHWGVDVNKRKAVWFELST